MRPDFEWFKSVLLQVHESIAFFKFKYIFSNLNWFTCKKKLDWYLRGKIFWKNKGLFSQCSLAWKKNSCKITTKNEFPLILNEYLPSKNKVLRYFSRNVAVIGAIGCCYDGLVTKTLHPLVKATLIKQRTNQPRSNKRKCCQEELSSGTPQDPENAAALKLRHLWS